jgi:ubiquilin
MSDEILVKVKQTSANKTDEIKIEKNASILEFKAKIEELTQMKPEHQNLVYKGRILANDKTLADYGVQNEHCIILVKKYVEEKKEETVKTSDNNTGTNNTGSNLNTGNNNLNNNLNQDPFSMFGQGGLDSGFGGLGGNLGGGLGGNVDMSQISQLMGNPMYQQAMDQMLSNPQMLQRMLDDPRIKPMLDANPHLRGMMSNPDFMRMMMNPQTLNSMMNMQGGLNRGTGQNTGTSTSTSTSNTGTNNLGGNNNTNPFGGFDINSLRKCLNK